MAASCHLEMFVSVNIFSRLKRHLEHAKSYRTAMRISTQFMYLQFGGLPPSLIFFEYLIVFMFSAIASDGFEFCRSNSVRNGKKQLHKPQHKQSLVHLPTKNVVWRPLYLCKLRSQDVKIWFENMDNRIRHKKLCCANKVSYF